jgi:hypothetical protein
MKMAPALPTRRGIEHDARAEDGRHERVGLGLIELLLGSPEVVLVGVGSGQQHDVAVAEGEFAHVAALGPYPLHEADGIDPVLVQVGVFAVAA